MRKLIPGSNALYLSINDSVVYNEQDERTLIPVDGFVTITIFGKKATSGFPKIVIVKIA